MSPKHASFLNVAGGTWQGVAAVAAIAGIMFACGVLFAKSRYGGGAVSVEGDRNKLRIVTSITAGEGAKVTVIGYTRKQHEERLEKLRQTKEKERDAAEGEAREEKQRALDEIALKQANLEQDYQERLQEIAKLKEQLASFPSAGKEDIAKAQAALNRGETEEAERLLTSLYDRSAKEADEAAFLKRKLKGFGTTTP